MYEQEFELAIKAATLAGEHLLSHYQPRVDSQAGKDIKLNADRESENIIITTLAESGYSLLSEERGFITGKTKQNGLRWIIDPLDGTANYWRGITELACVSVALWNVDSPVLGVVNRFSQGEVYCGVVGEGAWLNDKPIHTSDVTCLNNAFLATGFPVKRDYSEASLGNFIKQVQVCKKIRMLGTAAIMGALLAAGKFDIYIEDRIMLWDIAASAALVQAAGGAADLKLLPDNQCLCRLFANRHLQFALANLIKTG